MKTTISETFNKGVGGWRVAGDVASSGFSATGGDPGGYLSWTDEATGAVSYYQAGPKFVGHKMGFYGGTLSYDILDTGNGLVTYDVAIRGHGATLLYTSPDDAGFPTPNVWSHASVELIAANFIDEKTGAPPSVSEMKKVMSDIKNLAIRAEYVGGPESGGLDNVVLTRAPTVSSVPVAHAAHTELQSGWVS